MTLKENLFRNGIAIGLQKVIKILDQFLLVPFFLSAWGASYYGEYITLTIFPTILALSQVGVGSSAGNSLILLYTSHRYQEAANIIKSGWIIINFTVGISIVLSAIILISLNYFKVFELSLILKEEAIATLSIIMLARILTFYHQFLEAFYKACRKASLAINLMTVYMIINLASSVAILIMKLGIVTFALANLAITALFTLIFALVAVNILKFDSHYKGVVLKKDLSSILRIGFGYLLNPIWLGLCFQGTTFVVRILLGPESVTVFNTVRNVVRSINQLFGMVNTAFLPELQFELGQNRIDKVRKLFRTGLFIIFSFALSGILLLALFGPWVYQYWTAGLLNAPYAMWVIFISGLFFNALWTASEIVFWARNTPYLLTTTGLVSAIVSIGATFALCKPLGLLGAALGSVILDMLMAVYILPTACKMINQKMQTLPGDVWKSGLTLYRDLRNLKFGF